MASPKLMRGTPGKRLEWTSLYRAHSSSRNSVRRVLRWRLAGFIDDLVESISNLHADGVTLMPSRVKRYNALYLGIFCWRFNKATSGGFVSDLSRSARTFLSGSANLSNIMK